MKEQLNTRILIVDDLEEIHDAYKTALIEEEDLDNQQLVELANDLFSVSKNERDEKPVPYEKLVFEIESAFQGEDGVERVRLSIKEGRPFALLFMDMRMPPGINGLDSLKKVWEIDKDIEAVICTAHTDIKWSDILKEFGHTDKLLILKKPFEFEEIQQIAIAQVLKWNKNEQLNKKIENLKKNS
jgi:two-component system sensor histidine kinase/response regulator